MSIHPWTVALRHETHVPIDLLSGFVYAICAIGVLVLTLRRPSFGVAALIVLAPFDLARYVGPTTMTTLKAGVIGMIVALAIRRPKLAAFRLAPVRAMLAAFAALLVAIALSALHAQHLGAVVREGLKYGEYLLLFVVAIVAFATDPDDRPFWRMLKLTVALVCASALAEYLVGAHSGIFLHGKAWIFPRIAGALEGPNQLSGYLDIALPVLVARALVHRDRWLSFVILIAAITDVLTLSRGGIVGVLIGLAAVSAILNPPRGLSWRYATVIVVVLGIAVAAAVRAGVPQGYFSLDQHVQADHLANRSQLWHAAIALWQTSPLVGVGAGNYELDLAEVGLRDVRTHANSIYLQSLAEGGVVGLFAMLALIGTAAATLARSGMHRPLIVGALGATIALAAHQVVDDLFFFPKVAALYWLVMGVAVAEIGARRLQERRLAIIADRPAQPPAMGGPDQPVSVLASPLSRAVVMTIVIDLRWGVSDDVLSTLKSLSMQLYPHWNARVVLGEHVDEPTLERLIDYCAGAPSVSLVRPGGDRLGRGEFVGALGAGDQLERNALLEFARVLAHDDVDVVYCDEDRLDASGVGSEPWCKSAWSPQTVLMRDEIGRLCLMRTALVERWGGVRDVFENVRWYEALLRVTEHTDRVVHIPQVLCHRDARNAGEPADIALAVEVALQRRAAAPT